MDPILFSYIYFHLQGFYYVGRNIIAPISPINIITCFVVNDKNILQNT